MANITRFFDLVPRSRFGGSRTKNRGGGEGKGEEETRSGKIWSRPQISFWRFEDKNTGEGGGEGRGRERRKRDLANTIAWARFWPTRQVRMLEIWPVINMAVCTTSRCTDFDFYNALRFALQNRCSPDLKLKLKQLEVVKAIVQQRRHVLAVLPTGYGKSLTYQLLPNMSDSLFRGGRPGSITIVVSPLWLIGPDGRSAFEFDKKRPVICYCKLNARLGRKGGRQFDFRRHDRGGCSCWTCKHLVSTPRSNCEQQSLQGTAAFRGLSEECCMCRGGRSSLYCWLVSYSHN